MLRKIKLKMVTTAIHTPELYPVGVPVVNISSLDAQWGAVGTEIQRIRFCLALGSV